MLLWLQERILGVCPNLSHYELDEAYVNCDSERIGLPLLISESGDAQGPMLYSIMIVYQDGSRELMDGIDRSKMMEYLPYIKVE